MKPVVVVLLLLSIPLLIKAQKKGIQWTNGLSWEQIKNKAKAENKYIFLDCYATWCGPCKTMDKMVYTDESVGNFFNNRFIAVKVQMDSTKKDNDTIKRWYADAHKISNQYKLKGFPSYLFFSPEGKFVHRGLGFMFPPQFLILAREAIDPDKQYYTLLDNYQTGRKNYSALGTLALSAKRAGDNEIATVIAKDYKENYLDKLNLTVLCTKENIEFITLFPNLIKSGDNFFNLFFSTWRHFR